jgi:transcriptional regulator GlxA family with amidase domain
VRLELAAELLGRGETAIADVAVAVGFSSQSHFTLAFHNHFGTTPAALQKSLVSRRQSPRGSARSAHPPSSSNAR